MKKNATMLNQVSQIMSTVDIIQQMGLANPFELVAIGLGIGFSENTLRSATSLPKDLADQIMQAEGVLAECRWCEKPVFWPMPGLGKIFKITTAVRWTNPRTWGQPYTDGGCEDCTDNLFMPQVKNHKVFYLQHPETLASMRFMPRNEVVWVVGNQRDLEYTDHFKVDKKLARKLWQELVGAGFKRVDRPTTLPYEAAHKLFDYLLQHTSSEEQEWLTCVMGANIDECEFPFFGVTNFTVWFDNTGGEKDDKSQVLGILLAACYFTIIRQESWDSERPSHDWRYYWGLHTVYLKPVYDQMIQDQFLVEETRKTVNSWQSELEQGLF